MQKHLVQMIVAGAVSLLSVSAYSQVDACSYADTTVTTLDQDQVCSLAVVQPLEQRIRAHYDRLAKKYAASGANVPELIRLTKQHWNSYRQTECLLEGAAAMGTEANVIPKNSKEEKFVAEKYARCDIRLLKEQDAALSAL